MEYTNCSDSLTVLQDNTEHLGLNLLSCIYEAPNFEEEEDLILEMAWMETSFEDKHHPKHKESLSYLPIHLFGPERKSRFLISLNLFISVTHII